jgi:hypothetical protein
MTGGGVDLLHVVQAFERVEQLLHAHASSPASSVSFSGFIVTSPNSA